MKDSRRSERLSPHNQRVMCSVEGHGYRVAASVRDVSDTGIGLVIDKNAVFHPGEAVRVQSKRSGYPSWARVVRVVAENPSDNNMATVGCRWVAGQPYRRRRNNKPHDSIARRDETRYGWSNVRDGGYR